MPTCLRELVPGLRITVGHGQMDERELVRRMHAFTAHEYDVLLATTIIENGIDIPNVNTMIVHRADRFGLAQLYQLRGRVGRSHQLAYCYLLVPADRVLPEAARQRLAAMREFTELGAGFRIAARDLEIRGAGNLLGGEQSGHIADGRHRDLPEAARGDGARAERRGARGGAVGDDRPAGRCRSPSDYIARPEPAHGDLPRIAAGDASRRGMLAELRDRFGAAARERRRLIEVADLKRLAERLRVQSIVGRTASWSSACGATRASTSTA